MAETAKYGLESEMGCGFMGTFFQLKGFRPRNSVMFQDSPCSKKHLDTSKSAKPQSVQGKKTLSKTVPVRPRLSNCRDQDRVARFSDAARSSTSSSNNSASNKTSTRRHTREPTFTSSELSLALADQRKIDANGSLYRASTGNVMLLGHLGNLKQNGKGGKHDQKVAVEGNVRKRAVDTSYYQLGNILHSPRNRLNPDVIKSLGNQKYKQGKYEEALALYNQAIAIDPSNACYYSNKSAALMGLGRFVEAVSQCREAIRIDSSYHNAHCRLAKLYLRLGVAEKAVHHFKCSGRKAGPEDIAQAQAFKNCLDRCIEAQDHGNWRKLLDECQTALSVGADAAPQIYAMKAEAWMKLHRHQEAYAAIQNAPLFNIELYAELLGSSATADLLEVHALVYMANGRFEDALAAVQHALRLDSSNSMNLTAEIVKSVASARLNGNRLFKGSRFSEALVAYNKGLEKDPYNSILLCNRAACRSKLGQYEKAVEDCTAALTVRPSYSKARLRRANCNAKLEKWDAAIQDYELLMQEIPGDEEVRTALLEAKMQLSKLHSGHGKKTDTICNLVSVDIEDNAAISQSRGCEVVQTFRIYRQVKEIPGDNADRFRRSIRLYCT
ncbi:UNVERIFIED_CONTAM: TPR repeat-containing thioredoxin TTL1 [Sesamum radiatum]|uniref:TPR repeat-containing thioredoxin TTL1 n=1 Tax=Sesamum radiatum TaxID=300843 RepID=A0AAW2QEY8_SESRA